MTIAFDSANQSDGASAAVKTVVITVNPALTHRIVVASVCWHNIVNMVSMTFGGIAMTQYGTIDFNSSGGTPFRARAYYILAPLTGAQNLTATLSGGRAFRVSGVSYSGVDQAAPFLNLAQTASRIGVGALTINVPSEDGNLVVDFLGLGSEGGGAAATVDATQVQRNYADAAVGGGSSSTGQSDEVGAATVAMTWAATSVNAAYALIAGSLRPFVESRTRAVKYFTNVWDPTAAVRDGQSAKLQSNEVHADEWIQTDGFTLGESTAYDDFVKDPTKSRIVSVTHRRTGIDVKTSKNAFGDVIIARAAAGRM